MDAVRGAQLGQGSENLLRIFAEVQLEALDRYLDAAAAAQSTLGNVGEPEEKKESGSSD
jgi:hypothetical protein